METTANPATPPNVLGNLEAAQVRAFETYDGLIAAAARGEEVDTDAVLTAAAKVERTVAQVRADIDANAKILAAQARVAELADPQQMLDLEDAARASREERQRAREEHQRADRAEFNADMAVQAAGHAIANLKERREKAAQELRSLPGSLAHQKARLVVPHEATPVYRPRDPNPQQNRDPAA